MAYYLRSDNQPQHGGYMISNNSMQGGYLMHSAKGSEWKGPHKYIDKRWIQGAWHYLYEIPKEFAQRAGEAAKDTAEKVSTAAKNVGENIQKRHNYAVNEMKKTAEKAVDTVKDTAKKVQNDVKDLKDYSNKVDERRVRANEEREQRDSNEERNRLHNKIASAVEEREKAEKDLQDIDERWKRGEVVNQQEIHDAKKRAEDAKKREENARNALERAEEVREKDERTAFETSVEMQSAKYKASEALNKIDNLIDDASGSAKQGLQWLKNQLNSGADWTTDQIEKIRESDAVASLSGKLENLYANTNSKAAKTGLNIINQLIGWGNLGPVENVSRSSRSSSGRNYSGTGNKAQRREAVAGGPVSNNDYRRRPKR